MWRCTIFVASLLLTFSAVCLAEAPEKTQFVPASQCQACHPSFYDDWQNSAHARAWQKIAGQAVGAEEECAACHAPLSLLEYWDQVSTSDGLQRSPAPPGRDAASRGEGVSCATCHGLAGQMAGGRSLLSGGCNPVYDARVGASDLCASCHEVAAEGWRTSPFATGQKEARNCQECHFPRALRRAAEGGLVHSVPRHELQGLGQADFVKTAIDVSVTVRPGKKNPILNAVINNVRVGHDLFSPGRSIDLITNVYDSNGTLKETFRERLPGKTSSNQICRNVPAQGSFRLLHGLPVEHGKLAIWAYFKRSANEADEQSIMLAQREIEF